MKQEINFRNLILLLLLTAAFPLCYGQGKAPAEILEQLQHHQSIQKPRKLFIHFDKENYGAGETIWLKGYLVNALDHTPDTTTANVYLELWDVNNRKVQEIIVSPRDGVFQGQILLDADIADGNYVLRAYNDWMLNQGEDFLFYKYFYINNPGYANVIDNNSRRFNRDFNKQLQGLNQDVQIIFFPEGGNLVAGLESRVAVKVADATGKGRTIQGVIKDSNGQVIAEFQTNEAGMGVFNIKPESGLNYYAEYQEPSGRMVKGENALPEALREGFTLKADIGEQVLEIEIHSTQVNALGHSCVLLVHTRGETVFFKPDLMVQDQQTISIPLDELPTGITHITLFSSEAKPLAERLVFLNHDDQTYFNIRALMLKAGEDNVLNVDVLASNREGEPISGNFSVAVQYGVITDRSYNENIFSHLFLSSDLKGLVDNPVWYFDYERDDVEQIADLLMLTHGWRRFQWADVLAPESKGPRFFPQYGVNLRGSLLSKQNKLGVKNAALKMRVVENSALAFEVNTDDQGKFLFSNLPLADSTLIEFVPPMLAGKQLSEVKLDAMEESVSGLGMNYSPNLHTIAQQVVDRGKNWSRTRPDRQRQAPSRGGSLYGTPDQTVYIGDTDNYTAMIDILRDKVVNLVISGGDNITLGGPSSIMFQNPPIFIIDGVESQSSFLGANVRDIERIEVFRGASTAAFGSRGATGALVAYTRKRDFLEETTSSNIFLVSGLHAAREYYQTTQIGESLSPLNPVRTAFWEPMLVTSEEGLAQFQFFPIPGVSGYRIIIQGVGQDGKIGFSEFLIGN